MFTGIIERTARIRTVRRVEKGLAITIENPGSWKVARGASVSVDGICLTSTGVPGKDFSFHLMEETLSKTTAGSFAAGRVVNLERPLKVGDELGGHFVQGHIDTKTHIASVEKRGSSTHLTAVVPKKFAKLVAEVGSIAINGVSLTVAGKEGSRVSVALIPHTLASTNLGALKKGEYVNIEFDMLARYLAALARK